MAELAKGADQNVMDIRLAIADAVCPYGNFKPPQIVDSKIVTEGLISRATDLSLAL